MARQANQSKEWNFTVVSEPLMTVDGKDSGWLCNRRTDNGAVLGVTSEHYGIIQNSTLLSAAEEMFDNRRNELGDFKRNIITTKDGSRMFATYDFRDRTNKAVGDQIGMRLVVQNSFDRTLRASFSVGALRLVCTNGMVTMEREVSMTAKHSVNISTKFLDGALDKAIVAFDSSMKAFNELGSVSIEEDQGINILANMNRSGGLSKSLAQRFARSWNNRHDRYQGADAAPNLWNLYNSVTEELKGVESVELSSRTNDYVLRTLSAAVRKPASLQSLVKPVSALEIINN